MRIRFIAPVLAFVLPVLAAAGGCSDDSTTDRAPLGGPEGGLDATASDTSSPDTSADVSAPEAAVDAPVAADASDASVPDAKDANVADAADAADATDAADAADAAVATILPFATGLGANGAALDDQEIDPHWTVKDSALNVLTAFTQTNAAGYPGFWMAPSTTSKFISPFIDTVDPSGNGTFTYATTFYLRTGVNVANVQLVVRYASDNAMTAVTLNGQALSGVTAGGYSSFVTLNVSAPFVVGVNTIAFVVGNSGGPTGLRAELDLTAN